ncbi:MAG: hypothetical protein KAU38_13970 [Desulfobacterales bacterium]|nr:hypothetical protein [Desulfobacterales bacterium]
MANIQAVMHNINTSYTVYINRKNDRWGHLFQGRYKSIIVDKDNYLLALSRYIHLNPVRASMVSRPDDYSWSSYCCYIGRAAVPPYLHTVTTLAYFSTKSKEAQIGYRRFVEEEIHDEEDGPLVGVKGALVLGCEEFVRKIRNMIDKYRDDSELPSARRILRRLEISNALEAVSRYLETAPEELQRRSRGKRERSLAIYLVKRLSHVNNTVLGRHFGISGASAGARIRQAELEMRRDRVLKQRVESFIREISDTN